MAYMYVSAPIKAVTGIVYLGKRHLLSDWKEEYKNDIIVLAGKGHETYQEIQGMKHHLDEREEVADYLKEMRKS